MHVMIATTTATLEEAEAITGEAVGEGVAACAHVDGVWSCFRWEGEIRHEREFRVMLKTVE